MLSKLMQNGAICLVGSKIKRVKCPDGTTRYVYKDLDDAFRLELKDWSAAFKAQLNSLKLQELETSLEFQKQVSGLLMELDEVNRSLQFHFRALYSAYMNNPCELDKWYAEEVQRLVQTECKLRLDKIRDSMEFIRSGLANRPMDQQNVTAIITQSKEALTELSIREKTRQQIQTALDDFNRWRDRH